jgi:hypothetical protein
LICVKIIFCSSKDAKIHPIKKKQWFSIARSEREKYRYTNHHIFIYLVFSMEPKMGKDD